MTGHGHDWVALKVCLRKGHLNLVGVYMTDYIGCTGENLREFAELREYLALLRGPILMIGDWNMTPDEVHEAGVLRTFMPQHRLGVLTASQHATCSVGAGRLLYYCIGNDEGLLFIQDLAQNAAVPWKGHDPLSAKLVAAPGGIKVKKRVVPAPLPTLLGDRCSWADAQRAAAGRGGARLPEDGGIGGVLLPLCADRDKALQLGAVVAEFGVTLEEWALANAGLPR